MKIPRLTKQMKKKINSDVRLKNSHALLRAALILAHGDAYRGRFTNLGRYRYRAIKNELRLRLGILDGIYGYGKE